MNLKDVGKQIMLLRKQKGLTQSELAERLDVSFQAVSNWERGECLPDTLLLVDLADILETSVDFILRGGNMMMEYKGKIHVSDMRKGLMHLKQMGECLGKDNLIYTSAIEGINTKMNTDIEACFNDENIFEVFMAEAIIQNLMAGAYIDITDVKTQFKNEKYRNIVLDYASKYGIK